MDNKLLLSLAVLGVGGYLIYKNRPKKSFMNKRMYAGNVGKRGLVEPNTIQVKSSKFNYAGAGNMGAFYDVQSSMFSADGSVSGQSFFQVKASKFNAAGKNNPVQPFFGIRNSTW
jgi:hypothetical protein